MEGVETFAGFWRRAGAILIDGVLIWLVEFLVFMPPSVFLLSIARGQDVPVKGVLLVAVYLVPALTGWLYFALMESSPWQATLGKRTIGIRVTDERRGRIGFGRATGRHFSKYLSAIGFIGFLMAAFTARKQALHDLVAGTLVVRGN